MSAPNAAPVTVDPAVLAFAAANNFAMNGGAAAPATLVPAPRSALPAPHGADKSQ